MTIPSVLVFASERFSPFHLSVPCTVFGSADQNRDLFDLKVCAEKKGLFRGPYGFAFEAPYGLEAMEKADIVIIPYWPDPAECPSTKLIKALHQAWANGAKLVGLCRGGYALAYAGLLEGKRASTHWKYENDFKNRFPKTQLNTNVLYVNDDGVITSAGTAAGLDCCLYLVREVYGVAVANTIARRMVVPPHREGGQAQFIDRPLPETSGDTRITALLEELGKNLDQPHDVDSLAAKVMMSRRSFTRHFHQATGLSVVEWLTEARIRRSQELLELTKASVDDIASSAGFQSPVSFRKHFKSRFGVSPSAWRKTFQGQQDDVPRTGFEPIFI